MFVMPQKMLVPKSSVIRPLFKADDERDAANLEDLGIGSGSKAKRHGDLPTQMQPVLLALSSGGEAGFGKKLLPDYPEEFSPGEYLVVVVTLL